MFLGGVLVTGLLGMAVMFGLGKVEEQTSFGLTQVITIVSTIALGWAQWAFPHAQRFFSEQGTPSASTAAPTDQTTTPSPPTPKTTDLDNAAPATIVVNVPADARLTIDGEATTSTSAQRVFVSPVLNPGQEYHYTLKAEFKKDGKTVSVSKDVTVKAGNETRVTMDAESLAKVASR